MKKILLTLLLFICLFAFTLSSQAESTDLAFDDLTTLNFYKRSNELDFQAIKKICSYDYCSYREGESMKEALEIFTKKYLTTIKDEETRSMLKIKGIRITKIVLFNDIK